MKVLHFLASIGTGGIEVLCRDYFAHSSLEHHVVTFWDKGELYPEVEKDVASISFLDIGKNGLFRTWKTLMGLCKHLGINAIVIHNAAPLMHAMARMIRCILPSMAVIGYAHANAEGMCESDRLAGRLLRKPILSMCFRSANTVVAISESVKQSLMSVFAVPAKKITVIHNGVDLSRFTGDRDERQSAAVRFSYVGRLVEEKGVQITLEALAALRQDCWQFHIIGDGDYRPALAEKAAELQIKDKVFFWGNRKDVPDILRKMDCFLHMPACEEGFGIAVVEAMAAGTVCVCLPSGGIPEIITDQENGFLVEDLEQLTAKLEWLIVNMDSDRIDSIKKSAVVSVQRFSIQFFTKRLDELIENS